jgi:NADH dehydrogenase (ubiquinone) Fe-S protein 1
LGIRVESSYEYSIDNKTKVAVVGPEVDLTYPHQHLGVSTDTLLEIAEG